MTYVYLRQCGYVVGSVSLLACLQNNLRSDGQFWYVNSHAVKPGFFLRIFLLLC